MAYHVWRCHGTHQFLVRFVRKSRHVLFWVNWIRFGDFPAVFGLPEGNRWRIYVQLLGPELAKTAQELKKVSSAMDQVCPVPSVGLNMSSFHCCGTMTLGDYWYYCNLIWHETMRWCSVLVFISFILIHHPCIHLIGYNWDHFRFPIIHDHPIILYLINCKHVWFW
jgi:hypothetical protein